MHIGIITFHWALNYGAILQSYALQEVLTQLGHEVEIINYQPSWATDIKRRRFPHRLSEAIRTIDHYIYRYIFWKFRERHINISNNLYHKFDKIRGFDCVITGSDQVFNPDIIASGGMFDSTYLLSSVDKATKRISYAASFGNSTLAEEYKEQFRELLSSFSRISIREESGTEIIEHLGLKAVTVPDPTILLGDFTSLTSELSTPTDNYILNFIFQPSETIKMTQDIIVCESHMTTKSVIGIKAVITGKDGFFCPTPAKWISIVHNAHFVITDSFHSTVFCILNHRPFVSLVLDAWGGDWSERIKALLLRLGLEKRLLNDPTSEKIKEIYHTPINWDDIDRRLSEWRAEGIKFLKDALNTESNKTE